MEQKMKIPSLVKFRKYSGFRLAGKIPLELPSESALSPVPNINTSHIERAFWLTAHVESGGKFGSVMNYDGTGMTAGIHQAIAVYPKELANEDGKPDDDQGPLWKLLNRMRGVPGIESSTVFEMLKRQTWYVSKDGHLRWSTLSNTLVLGATIRTQLSGLDGYIPSGPRARACAFAWVQAFHELFSNPYTFSTQIQFALEHITKSAMRWEGPLQGIYPSNVDVVETEELGPELDLAMAVFWSYSVNAPAKAKSVLIKARAAIPKGANRDPIPSSGFISSLLAWKPFAQRLIRDLGNTTFARWDDDLKTGRYQRTRTYAMKLWPKSLFVGPNAIMPKDLPG